MTKLHVLRPRGHYLVWRLWTPALRWTWPLVTPSGYGVGQQTTQIGFQRRRPHLPHWREVRRVPSHD